MKKILIYGNNSISGFLLNGLNYFDYETVDITNIADIAHLFTEDENIECIIDTSNALETLVEEDVLFHNNEGIVELLFYSNRYKIPFLFVYKEPANASKDSSITFAIENIEKFKKPASLFAKVQIEDVYGPDLNTSHKIDEYLQALAGNNNVTVEDDLSEFYLLHQKDFFSGIICSIKDLKATKKPRIFTLFPEDPITEIELAHLITELTDLNLEIDYMSEEVANRDFQIDIDATYPINWQPNIDIKTGVLELFKYYGIPPKTLDIKEDKKSEVIEDEIENIIDDEPEDTITTDANPNTEDETEVETPAAEIIDTAVVDSLPTNIEVGATYYRPVREEPVAKTPNQHSKPAPKKNKKKKIVAVASIATFLFLLTLLPTVGYVSRYNQVVGLIEDGKNYFDKQEYDLAVASASKAVEQSKSLNSIPFYITQYASYLGIQPQSNYDSMSELTKYAEMQKNLALAYKQLNIANTAFENTGNSNVLGASVKDESAIYIDKLKELNDMVNKDKVKYSLYNQKLNDIKKSLIEESELMAKVDTKALHKVFGLGGKQTYLFTVTDPDFISSTGGQIIKFGKLEFDNGKLTFIDEKDIKEFDDLVFLNQSSYPAPQAIQTLKQLTSMPASNSNWDPDYYKNAESFINLYKRNYEDTHLDGAISINKETYEELKRNVMTQDRVTLLGTIIDELSKKNILVFHNDGQIRNYLYDNVWTGTLNSYTDDYLYVIDSNLSEDPISRKVEKEVEYVFSPQESESTFLRELKLKYKNTSDKDYIDHIRIVVPNNVLLNNAYLLQNGEKSLITRSLKMESYGKYNVISGSFYTKAGDVSDISIEYESPYKTLSDQTVDLTLQKQPGQSDVKTVVKLKPAFGEEIVVFDQPLGYDEMVEIPL